jgi:hypothetical protein
MELALQLILFVCGDYGPVGLAPDPTAGGFPLR